LATALRLTERYCVVYQTLVAHPPVINVTRQRAQTEAAAPMRPYVRTAH
jgi:hypothetical protein